MMNKAQRATRVAALAVTLIGLNGCSGGPQQRQTYDLINQEMAKAAASAAAPQAKAPAPIPAQVADALLLPTAPRPAPVRTEERFSVAFNEVPARQFFPAIGAHTRYNIVVHPDVAGTISANLKNVTLFEALDSIRDIYGYDYTIEGNRIVIKPLTLQTRIFHVNYLNTTRLGTSDTRVSGGGGSSGQQNGAGQSNNGNGSNSGGGSTGQTGANSSSGNGGTGGQGAQAASSRVSSTSSSDFWTELRDSLRAIVGIDEREVAVAGGAKSSRSVVVSRQSGVIVVRAMPEELRAVAQYLRASQLSVERQVILEAKILEVQLNDRFQAGINWASFAPLLGNPLGLGFVAPGTTLVNRARAANTLSTDFDVINPLTGLRGASSYSTQPGSIVQAAGDAAGSIFGLALQSNNFAALLTFLESQGSVHVLSSPRIATMNNQKAILKVGTDDFFVTKVSSTINTSGSGASTTTPDVTLQQFFSGVVLDVTPQIDELDNIILHVHPSVTDVTTLNRVVNLGQLGTLTLPLASSNTSETDSVVRGQHGQIIAIGGLMRQASMGDKSEVPGLGEAPVVGGLFKTTSRQNQKRELVILIKPTIVDTGGWGNDINEAQRRIEALDPQAGVRQR